MMLTKLITTATPKAEKKPDTFISETMAQVILTYNALKIRYAKPRVNICNGSVSTVRIGRMNMCRKVIITAALSRLSNSPDTKPGIILPAIQKATKFANIRYIIKLFIMLKLYELCSNKTRFFINK
jgi:hypothetical protein